MDETRKGQIALALLKYWLHTGGVLAVTDLEIHYSTVAKQVKHLGGVYAVSDGRLDAASEGTGIPNEELREFVRLMAQKVMSERYSP